MCTHEWEGAERDREAWCEEPDVGIDLTIRAEIKSQTLNRATQVPHQRPFSACFGAELQIPRS